MSKYDDRFAETAPDESVFADKGALDPLTEPAEISARGAQEREFARILTGVHDGYLPLNLKECRTLFRAANEILAALTGTKKGAYEGVDGVFDGIWAALEMYPAWTVLLLAELEHGQQDTNGDPSDFFSRLLRGEGTLACGNNRCRVRT